MRAVFSILSLLMFLPLAVSGQEQEEEVSWEQEEQAAIRGPRLQAGPARGATTATADGAAAAPAPLPAPQLVPLPEIETSAWAMLFPGVCLALVALNVSWRRKDRSSGSERGGLDD